MTAAALLTPMRTPGYGLAVPPRAGTWRVNPAASYVQLCIRHAYRRSFFTTAVHQGAARLTDLAGSSAVELRFDSHWTGQGTHQAAQWLEQQGFGSVEFPGLFGSELILASPDGWRMSGWLSAARLETFLVADARIEGVRTQPNGQDAMLVRAVGAIPRHRQGVRELQRTPRVSMRIQAQLIHD
jgi:hypothetical protein